MMIQIKKPFMESYLMKTLLESGFLIIVFVSCKIQQYYNLWIVFVMLSYFFSNMKINEVKLTKFKVLKHKFIS